MNRPAFEKSEQDFKDVPEESEGWLEITYGKNRGIIDDADSFYPNQPLSRHDALMWLFRTRNVEELPDMQEENLEELLEKYPALNNKSSLLISSSQELIEMMQLLDAILRDEVHEVSYYADDFHGKGTAFGEKFDMNAITAAHRSYPHNTMVKVTNEANGKVVTVRINDRGPYVHGRDMDLSKAAFYKIDSNGGILNAKFERLGDKELIDQCINTLRRYQKRITRDVRFHRGVPHNFSTGETLTLGSNRWFVIRGITYPDGSFVRFQEFVGPKEHFSFIPSEAGEYRLLVGTKTGRQREMIMRVAECAKLNSQIAE